MVRYRRKEATGAEQPTGEEPPTHGSNETETETENTSSADPPSTTTVASGIRCRRGCLAASSPSLSTEASSSAASAAAEGGGGGRPSTTIAIQSSAEVEPWGSSSAKDQLKGLLQDETSWVYTVWNKEGKYSQASRICQRIEEIQNRSPLFLQYPNNIFYTNFQ